VHLIDHRQEAKASIRKNLTRKSGGGLHRGADVVHWSPMAFTFIQFIDYETRQCVKALAGFFLRKPAT